MCRVGRQPRAASSIPIGKVLYEAAGWVSSVRVSPDGRLLAFVDCPQRGNNDGHLKVVDTNGKVRLDGPDRERRRNARLVAEGRRGVVRATTPASTRINAVSLDGKIRPVWTLPVASLEDLSRDGRVLLTESTARRELVGVRARRSAAQPHGAQLVVSERHLRRRQHRSLLRADPPAARRLRAQARRLARGAPGRRRGLRLLAGRPVRADGQAARAPADHPRPDGRGRVEDPGRRQHHLRLGQLVPGRKANPGQRPGGRQGRGRACSSWTCRAARRSRSPRKASRSSLSPSPPTAGPSWPAGRTAGSRSTGRRRRRAAPGPGARARGDPAALDVRRALDLRLAALGAAGGHRRRGHRHRAPDEVEGIPAGRSRAASSRPAPR